MRLISFGEIIGIAGVITVVITMDDINPIVLIRHDVRYFLIRSTSETITGTEHQPITPSITRMVPRMI